MMLSSNKHSGFYERESMVLLLSKDPWILVSIMVKNESFDHGI